VPRADPTDLFRFHRRPRYFTPPPVLSGPRFRVVDYRRGPSGFVTDMLVVVGPNTEEPVADRRNGGGTPLAADLSVVQTVLRGSTPQSLSTLTIGRREGGRIVWADSPSNARPQWGLTDRFFAGKIMVSTSPAERGSQHETSPAGLAAATIVAGRPAVGFARPGPGPGRFQRHLHPERTRFCIPPGVVTPWRGPNCAHIADSTGWSVDRPIRFGGPLEIRGGISRTGPNATTDGRGTGNGLAFKVRRPHGKRRRHLRRHGIPAAWCQWGSHPATCIPSLFHVDQNLIRDQEADIPTPMPPQSQSGFVRTRDVDVHRRKGVLTGRGSGFGLWIAVTLHNDSGTELTTAHPLDLNVISPGLRGSSIVALADSAPATGHTGSAAATGPWARVLARRQEVLERVVPT